MLDSLMLAVVLVDRPPEPHPPESFQQSKEMRSAAFGCRALPNDAKSVPPKDARIVLQGRSKRSMERRLPQGIIAFELSTEDDDRMGQGSPFAFGIVSRSLPEGPLKATPLASMSCTCRPSSTSPA